MEETDGTVGTGRRWDQWEVEPEGGPLPRMRVREVVFTTPYQRVFRTTLDFGGFEKEYFVNDFRARAGVLAVRDGRILMVRQYRMLVDGECWEIPGGAVGETETPEEAAARECREETGVRCRRLRPLLSFHAGLEIVYNPTHIFLSEDVELPLCPHAGDPREARGSDWIPLEECRRRIRDGRIRDSFTLLALLVFEREPTAE